MNDTICAIATCVGESSINIIRISGLESINIVNNLFDKDLTLVNGNTINYGHIIFNNEIIDEVLVSVFLSPRSFTTENLVEINVHGGVSTVNKIMSILLNSGCRLAEPGEFTKRAFLNGRISLTEAEAIQDLISSKGELFRKISQKGINKEIYNIVKKIKSQIIPLLGNIEVNIDYPEYEDIEIVTIEKIKKTINNVENTLKPLVKNINTGILIKNGITISIVGRPNVGKSSLLNKLINEDKAIVTNIEGTTRDIVEGKLIINGVEATIYDTAGIRDTSDIIEQIGVSKSLKSIDDSDLILLVLDSSSPLQNDDKKIIESINNKNCLIILNKNDIKEKYVNEIELYLKEKEINKKIIYISTLEDKSISNLKEEISKIFKINDINSNDTYITNARQISLFNKCLDICHSIENAILQNLPVDIIEIDIKELWDTLGEINGDSYKEELLDEIFSRFCLGK